MTQLNRQFWLPVKWQAHPNVKAIYTTRYAIESPSQENRKVDSEQPSDYSDFNLALHVGDDPDRVLHNRGYLREALDLPTEPVWLEQVHSNKVIDLDSSTVSSPVSFEADGSYTRSSSKVCCVMTADCLPVLLSNLQGDWVSAVHAGWRGLASGIIENAVSQYPGKSSELIAWLGPAISQQRFEIGEEVKKIFVQQNDRFASAFKPVTEGKFLADLYQIATQILIDLGIKSVGGNHCTYQETDKFYSYRRHAITGRMASLIWINNK